MTKNKDAYCYIWMWEYCKQCWKGYRDFYKARKNHQVLAKGKPFSICVRSQPTAIVCLGHFLDNCPDIRRHYAGRQNGPFLSDNSINSAPSTVQKHLGQSPAPTMLFPLPCVVVTSFFLTAVMYLYALPLSSQCLGQDYTVEHTQSI